MCAHTHKTKILDGLLVNKHYVIVNKDVSFISLYCKGGKMPIFKINSLDYLTEIIILHKYIHLSTISI